MGIFVDRSTLPGADPSTIWLADLIEATEVLAASAEPCDPAIVRRSAIVWQCAPTSGRCSSRPPWERADRKAAFFEAACHWLPVKLPSSSYLTYLFGRSVALRA